MATAAGALAPPTKIQIAKKVAGGMPSELSKRPLVGILGVVLGAGVVTLTGRMITLGLADLKGSVGIGFDEGAWIGSAFNVALMFIGPFTVYVGGLLGARRVLLAAASCFTVICALLPLVNNYSLLITALVLAGLTSGTFYPLTLTFALRNIPLPYLPFTLALYATSVDGAVNIAPSLTAGIATIFRFTGCSGIRRLSRRSCLPAFFTVFPVHLREKAPDRHLALRDFFTEVLGLRCYLRRSTKGRDWIGGARGYTTHSSSAGSFFSRARSFAGSGGRIRWLICHICACGTPRFSGSC